MDAETVQGIGNFISQVGFPIAVAGYVIVYNNKTIARLTLAVEKLTLLIDRK